VAVPTAEAAAHVSSVTRGVKKIKACRVDECFKQKYI
jgi:hypothetical protein